MKIYLIILFLSTLLLGAVDINNATKEELVTLKGIGLKKATKILKYRKKNCFKNLKELKKVKGIKKKQAKKIIRKNKGNISIGACKVNGS